MLPIVLATDWLIGSPPPNKARKPDGPPAPPKPEPPRDTKDGFVEFTTVISAPVRFLNKPVVVVEVPAASESSTNIIPTPTTMPETVKTVRVFLRRRLLKAMLIEDMLTTFTPRDSIICCPVYIRFPRR